MTTQENTPLSTDLHSVYVYEDGFRTCLESQQKYDRECIINSDNTYSFKKFRLAKRFESKIECYDFARQCLGETVFNKLF